MIVSFDVKLAEKPVALELAQLHSKHFMLLVKKTKAILYSVQLNKELKNLLNPICGIHLNSTVTRTGIMNAKLYNRFFTAAHFI